MAEGGGEAAESRMMWAMGLMSGTSMDGVDAALIRTDGETVDAVGPTLFRPYGESDRALLRQALAEAATLSDRAARPGVLAEAEMLVTDLHAIVASELAALAASRGMAPSVIGFHGQTVLHDPAQRLTIQIGDGIALAAATSITVVHDLRAADVAAGGQGAPLVPVYHRALARRAGLAGPVAFLNIGGVANLTLIDADGDLVAFDTGPGNAIIDDLVMAETGAQFDRDGAIGASGRVDEVLLREMTADDAYLAAPPPKSLDRGHFNSGRIAGAGIPFPDRVATAGEVIAETVRIGLLHAQCRPARIIVCGGGARNPHLLARIAARTGLDVVTAAALGLDPDFIEAQAFAYLAVRRLRGLPASFPGTTGVPAPTIGGEIASPPAGRMSARR